MTARQVNVRTWKRNNKDARFTNMLSACLRLWLRAADAMNKAEMQRQSVRYEKLLHLRNAKLGVCS